MGFLSPIDTRVSMMPGALAIYKDEFIAGFRELTDAIHTGGARVGVQLSGYG